MDFLPGFAAGIGVGIASGVATGQLAARREIEAHLRSQGLTLRDAQGNVVEIDQLVRAMGQARSERMRPGLLVAVAIGVAVAVAIATLVILRSRA